jgi:hypothetical protein
MIENTTTLGLALHGYLMRPVPLDQSPAIALQTRIDTLLAEVEHLQAVGLVSETQRQAIVDAVPHGSIPEPVSDPDNSHPVGTVLITTARLYQPFVSVAYDVVSALSAVTAAAITGNAHSGPEAALVCASVAAVRALAAGHKREEPVLDAVFPTAGHKESERGDAGHKQ